MTGALAELHDDLRATARRLVGGSPSALGAAGPPVLDWAALARADLLGLEIPEDLGGSGGTFAEVAVVLKEMAQAPAVSPYLGSAVLSTTALLLAEARPGRDELLCALAGGATTAALMLEAGDAAHDGSRCSFTRAARGGEVCGHAEMVVDAPQVDRLLCLSEAASGTVLAEVVLPAEGLVIEERPLVDATRRAGAVTADRVLVANAWPLASGAVDRLSDVAATAVACDSLGLMLAMLEATVAYVKVRKQFGRPIGSFQAVQHACADMLVQVEMSSALVHEAVTACSTGTPGDERRAAVARAKSYAGAAAVEVCGKAIQLHGGIGYAWESGIHAFLKRASLNRALFGSPIEHRRRLMALRLDGPWGTSQTVVPQGER